MNSTFRAVADFTGSSALAGAYSFKRASSIRSLPVDLFIAIAP